MPITQRDLPRASLLLTSLLCAALSGQAQAVSVVYQGAAGTNGQDGAMPGFSGWAGGQAPDLLQSLLSNDMDNLLQLTGGAGGNGGDGRAGNSSVNGGWAGAGGNGARSNASLIVTTTGPGALDLYSAGGKGGNPGQPGAAGVGTSAGQDAAGGAGGDAGAFGAVYSTSWLRAEVTAVGGQGGDGGGMANGGRGGNANSSVTGMSTDGPAVSLFSTATGGNGGSTLFGTAGQGGDARSEILLPSLGAAQVINVASLATGGKGGGAAVDPDQGIHGTPGAGGYANSKVTLASVAPSNGGWSAVINGSSTAIAGTSGGLVYTGAAAEASLTIQGYGEVNGTASATGAYGSDAGGRATASSDVSSNYIANAKADAVGGNSYVNPGAGATASASAHGGYAAYANALGTSGSGHAAAADTSYATAQASVLRNAAAPSSSKPSEARAYAGNGTRGSVAQATATYTDTSKNASVVATTAQRDQGYGSTGSLSVANVGGDAPQSGPDGSGEELAARVVSHAVALPTTSSVATLLNGLPHVQAAFPDNKVLGAGTMGAMYSPTQADNAEFHVPFAAGSHLLLGLLSPFPAKDFDTSLDFSVSNNGVTLYSASFSSQAQAVSFFTDHVLDLGVINSSALDLLIGMHLSSGMFGYDYVFGEGNGVTPVPEPQTWLMLMAGMSLMLWVARKRRVS